MARVITWISSILDDSYQEPQPHFHSGPGSTPAVCFDDRCSRRASAPAREVGPLVVGEGVDADAERRQLEPRDLAVDVARDRVDAGAELAARATRCSTASAWMAKRHVHDLGRMALAGGEVDDAARRPAGSARPPTSYCSTSGRTSRGPAATARSSSSAISTSKWPALASMAPSLMRSKCSRRRTRAAPVTVTKRSPRSAASQRRHHLEALHPGLQRAHRVDLADDDLGAGAARAVGDPRPVAAVAEHDQVLPASSRLVARRIPSSADWPVP